MSDGFWFAILIVAAVLVYVLAKILFYVRKSEQQWQEVDKTRLKVWDDDDDWD